MNAKKSSKRTALNAGKLERWLERHVRRKERGKALYKKADAALDRALALGPPLDQPISVQFRDGKNIVTRQLVVKDVFAETNTAFKSVSAHRFAVADYKKPKPEKKVSSEV
jgi:hypothetical protein